MADYLIAFALVFAINLMPAFGPPTWSLLVFCLLQFELVPWLLVAVGALAAAAGRYVLALGARRYRGRLRSDSRHNLDAAKSLLAGNRGRALAGLGLFAVSPLPSAQLFVAAGLLRIPLLPLTVAFFSGRVVSYSIYVGGAVLVGESLGEVLRGALGSPLGIALQLLMLAGLVALVRVDWAGVVARHSPGP